MAIYHLITWNVAGLRACARKGFLEFLNQMSPDILALQEVKAFPEQLSQELIEHPNYDIFYAPAERPGYSGVGLWVKKGLALGMPETQIGIPEYDCEGRVQILQTKDFYLINVYFPNGRRDHSRVDFKLHFTRYLFDLATHLRISEGKEVIICGDVNTAHREIDLSNPKANEKTTGFLPIERDLLSEVMAEGWSDAFRVLHPHQVGAYSWWTFRNDCRARNIGWRLDYFLVSDRINAQIKTCKHLDLVMGSDHCPVSLVFG